MPHTFSTMPHFFGTMPHIFGTMSQIFGTLPHIFGTMLHIFGPMSHSFDTMPPIFGTMPSAANKKIRPRNLKLILLSDDISTKIRPKADSNSLFSCQNQTSTHTLFRHYVNQLFFENIPHLWKFSIFFCFMWKAEKLKIRLSRRKSGLFRQKMD